MRTKTQWKRAVWASALVLAVGCRTPSAMGPMGAGDSSAASDSGNSSDGNSSKSDSGNSSDANSSKSDSGNSSDGNSSKSDSGSSDHSSDPGGSSHSGSSDNSSGSSDDSSGSSDSTDSDSSESKSGSSEHSSDSSNSKSGSSENSDSGTTHTEKPEGQDSRTESDSSQSKDGNVMSATTVAATVVGLGVVIWQAYAAAERRRGPAPAPAEVGRAAQVYLRARTHQLREDLALGAGPTVEDLAEAARIRRSNLGTFGRLLREHRKELLALADARTLTPERALAWMQRVGELARTEPRLEEDRQAFLAGEGTVEVAR